MTFTARKFLGCSHIAVLGLGLILGLRGFLESNPQRSSSPDEAASVPSLKPSMPVFELDAGLLSRASAHNSTAEYAAAWDSLKGRFLPSQERLLIEKTLLEEWSVIDLAAAVRAVFAETTDQGPDGFGEVGIFSLLECCEPGIQADPLKAWELIRSRAFGMETGRFRNTWLECMIEANPDVVFSVLGELPKNERLSTLSLLAELSCTADEPATRAAIWAHLSALPDTADDHGVLTHVGETICFYTPPVDLATRLLGELTPSGREICISGLALALYEVVENEDFPKPLDLLPIPIRGEVAAAGLKHGIGDEKTAMFLANVALDSGNLNALQDAAADPAFARFAEEMDQPLALTEWALRLPEDSRTLEIFRQCIKGAASSDLKAIRAKLEALNPGWQRKQGMAALTRVEEQRQAEEE